MMAFHHSRSTVPVGIGPLKEEGEELIQTVRFFGSDLAKNTQEAIIEGKDSVEFSYTFYPNEYYFDDQGIVFKEVEVYETSPVLKGASINTGVKEKCKSMRDAFAGKLSKEQLQELARLDEQLKAAGITAATVEA